MPKDNKEKAITVRVTEYLQAEFRIACSARGETVSGLLHRVVVRTVREERDRQPELFTEELVAASIEEAREEQEKKLVNRREQKAQKTRLKLLKQGGDKPDRKPDDKPGTGPLKGGPDKSRAQKA